VDWTELHTRTLQQVWETDLVGSSEIAATRIIPAMRRVDHEIVAACVGVDPAVRVLDPLCRTHDVDDWRSSTAPASRRRLRPTPP